MLTLDFLFRYGILLISSIVLLRAIYFRISPNRDAVFSFFLFANSVFFVTFLLHNIDLSMGFAFGLFAVFAMLRYRTEPISIRDMTYLFVVIGLSLMCSVAKLPYIELVGISALVCALSAIAETKFLAPRVVERKVNYDKVELVKPENRKLLIDDLCERTGLKIVKVEVGRLDYLSDSAQLIIFYNES